MAEPACAEPRYRAFLSYSHNDAADAAWLHRRLEGYRLPKRLAGTTTVHGTVPARLVPIFRDRDEMAASADLSETVRAALADAAALIVLCSPGAVASRWVAEEIRLFRSLRPGAPVLAAIVAGDPPGCFPAPLLAAPDGTPTEPLATDLRRQGDGRHLGLLKLVAGVAGVPLDDLVQRDASRRVRRVTAITAGALVAMLVMAALTVFALDARREAERERAEAEGLIEFMLTDLRDRLRGVGRLDIMEAVNVRALDHYGRQTELEALPRSALLQRARTLNLIGQDQSALGNVALSLASFRASQRATEQLLKRDPDDRDVLHEHARSLYRIGRIHESRREWSSAERHFVRAREIAEGLLSGDPGNSDFMMLFASTSTDLGNLQLYGTRNAAAAQRTFESAISWFGRAVRQNRGDANARRAYANAYANLADTFYAREQWRESLRARLRQYAIIQQLHDSDPANLENGYRLAAAQRGVAASLAKVGDSGKATELMLRAHAWSERLNRHDPRNAEWLLFRGMIGCELYFRGGDRLPLSRERLRGEIQAAHAALAAQRNPRGAQLAPCVRAVAES